MKAAMKLATAALLMVGTASAAQTGNPVGKVVQLLTDLEAKITTEGADSKKLFEEFSNMCEDRTRELKFEIKEGKKEAGQLEAVIAKESADLQSLAAKIEELAASSATADAELTKATELRKTEAADFAVAEKELVDTIDTIDRASVIIQREMNKGASFAQMSGAKGLSEALNSLVEASSVDSADRTKLAALIQSQSSDEAVGAPDAAVYESQSGGIFDALDSLKDKAEDQLADARKAETEALHAFGLKEQGLKDEIKFAEKDMAAAKKNSAAATEKKATAEGDLGVTSADLAADEKSLEELTQECMEKAQAYEEEVTSRTAELKALASAKTAVTDATGGAEDLTYSLAQTPSFLQVGVASNEKVVGMVRRLAFAQHSAALAQLASRMESAARTSADPFAKVKGLISEMVDRLEAEADAEATQKAFCDKEMSESNAKKDEATATHNKLTIKMEQASASSTKLSEEVATLQKELAELAKTQMDMDNLRAEEKAVYEKNKPEIEQGIEGVKLALKIIRDYYAADGASHDQAEGAATGIISLLEVCESDFSKLLATMIAEEEAAASEYDAQTKENEITKTTKDQDVSYKTKEIASLEKAMGELKADAAGVQEQLDAVKEYLKELEKQCVAKAETYEERVERRNAEIAGLKDALEALNAADEESLIQASRHVYRRGAALRGSSLSA